jgi:hypothetical protein
LTHWPLQSVNPAWHDSAHAPSAQTSPAAQALPHAPQSVELVATSTQTPAQDVPLGQAPLVSSSVQPREKMAVKSIHTTAARLR